MYTACLAAGILQHTFSYILLLVLTALARVRTPVQYQESVC